MTFARFLRFLSLFRTSGVGAPKHAVLSYPRVDVVLPGRRAVTTVCSASSSVGAHGQCLRVRKQWSTDPWTHASKNLGQFIQGERA